MKLTVVYDNRATGELRQDWGFGCLIEMPEGTLLFDTGADWSILKYNMERLGIDAAGIDGVFISHLHWDHTGGLSGLIGEIGGRNVYLPATGSEDLAAKLEAQGCKVERISAAREIGPGLHSTGPRDLPGAA